MNSHITLSQAIEGYLLDARARQLSPRTISGYIYIFQRFQDHVGDISIVAIKADDVRRFLADLCNHRVESDGVDHHIPSRFLRLPLVPLCNRLSHDLGHRPARIVRFLVQRVVQGLGKPRFMYIEHTLKQSLVRCF
jgi:hypothetical protein